MPPVYVFLIALASGRPESHREKNTLSHHDMRIPHAILLLLLALLSLPATAADWIYTVVEGDNLWDLSEKHLDSELRFEQVRRLNNVEFPKRMQPGTRLRIPMKWIRSNPVPARIGAIRGEVELVRSGGVPEAQVSAGRYPQDRHRQQRGGGICGRLCDHAAQCQ